jgi:asparagine synthase (glutamine-hydrolysing)
MQQIINDVKSKKLSYLSKTGLADIANAVKSIEDNSIEGLCIEAGCALGGSAIVIAKAKEQGRRFNVYDVFATIPPPTEKDGKDVLERYENIKEGKALGLGGDKYYGYENDLKKKVIDSIAVMEYNITWIS